MSEKEPYDVELTVEAHTLDSLADMLIGVVSNHPDSNDLDKTAALLQAQKVKEIAHTLRETVKMMNSVGSMSTPTVMFCMHDPILCWSITTSQN